MGFSIGSASPRMGPKGALNRLGGDGEHEARPFDWRVVARMLTFLKPYWGRMVLAFFLMLLSSGLTLLTPYLVKVAIDQHIAARDTPGLIQISIFTGLAFLGQYVAAAGQRYLLGWVGQRVLTNMRDQLFVHLQRLSLGYHDTHIVGVTVSRVINDVAVINDLLSQGLITLLGDLLVLGGIIAVMLSMSFELALYTFSVLPLMILVTYLFSRKARVAFRATRSTVAALIGTLAEDIAGMRVIQAFAQEARTHNEFDHVDAGNRDSHVQAMTLSFIFLPSVEFLGILATAIVLYFGGLGVREGEVTLGVMVAFLAYVTRFFQPIQELSQLYTTMQAAMAGGEEVLRLLDSPPAVEDRPDAAEMPPISGDITLKDVRFAYREGLPDVLKDINLHIKSGQTVALVGPTGAGKTSIANLVARFYDVSEGAVKIDGIDVRSVKQRSLRRQMGLVSQDPFLFSGTIADNIRFSSMDTPLEKVKEAARLANAAEFITDLPDKYETPILEGGVNLSLGQRQLICIARAVLADPGILIMDEATANVDTVTEGLIQESLQRLLTRRTALVIAHRLSTIRDADVICVVDDGEIVERGDHASLLAQKGLYHTLYERQYTEVIEG